MFLLRKPDYEAIAQFVNSQKDLPFSYPEIEATRTSIAPKGYVADLYRVKLGEGEEAYRRAVDALRDWRQFGLGWTSLHPPGAGIEAGSVVAVLVRHFGFRSLNPARIVYTVEDNRSYPTLRLRLRDAPRSLGEGRGVVLHRVGPRGGLRPLCRLRVLAAQPSSGLARLPVHPDVAEAVHPRFTAGYGRGVSPGEHPVSLTAAPPSPLVFRCRGTGL